MLSRQASLLPMDSVRARGCAFRLAARNTPRPPKPVARASLSVGNPSDTSAPPGPSAPAKASSGPEQPTAMASVDVGDAIEKLTVPVQSADSSLMTVTLQLPMGIVLEESEGMFVVVEVTPGSSAANSNVQVGDVLRVVTAASMQMTYPTMNLMLGGVGRPKVKRVALPVFGRPFAWLREAIKSNSQLPGNSITLVLERPARGTGPCMFDGSEEVVATHHGSLFDPRIFE